MKTKQELLLKVALSGEWLLAKNGCGILKVAQCANSMDFLKPLSKTTKARFTNLQVPVIILFNV